MRQTPLLAAALVALAAWLGLPGPSAAQEPEPTYMDSTAARIHRAARAEWDRIDETVVRYTATVKQRMAAQLRTPLKDRTLYRQEAAHRVFWDRDGETLVQVLGLREQTPAGVEDYLDDDDPIGNFDQAFDPAGDRLLFGFSEKDDDEWGEADDDDFWVAHPLAPGGEDAYRYRSGDTLTLSLPDGRSLRVVELQVIPRDLDVHKITGSLWIEPESGALVRAAYRLADTFDALRDIPDLEEDAEDGLKYVPGLFKPFTFELEMIAVDYALWDFEVWLPRSLRMEGVAAAGMLKFPATMEMAYTMESVRTEADLQAEAEAGELPRDVREEKRFGTRAEAMEYLASLVEEDGVSYRPASGWSERDRRRTRYLVPEDPTRLIHSSHLPPPVWEDAPGFPTEDELEETFDRLADLPAPEVTTAAWAANWGLERPDLVRYNRVEALAVGARLQARSGSPFGPLSYSLEPFIGVADLEPKARLTVERETLKHRFRLGVYRELQAVNPREGHLGFGNSLTALLWGRDDGEYFLATGADVTWTPPSARRESFELRLYAERHDDVDNETDFSLTHAFEDDWEFRPSIDAVEHDEVGVELRLSPWWGTDPLAPQFGVEVYGQVATGDDPDYYSRARVLLRGIVPFRLFGRGLKAGIEVEGGRGWGEVPTQRHWYVGSVGSLRGYEASTLSGSSFGRTRVEVSRGFPAVSVALFSDAGWAGPRPDAFVFDDALVSVGVGATILDGLVRLDVSRALRDDPFGDRDTRVDFYLDAAF